MIKWVLVVPDFLHGEAEFGNHVFKRNRLVVLEPLAGFSQSLFFFRGYLFVFRRRAVEGTGIRIEHYLHEVHNGSHLSGAKWSSIR